MSNDTESTDQAELKCVCCSDISLKVSPVTQNIAVTQCTTQQEQWGQLSLCKLLCFKDFFFLRTHLILFTGRGWYLSCVRPFVAAEGAAGQPHIRHRLCFLFFTSLRLKSSPQSLVSYSQYRHYSFIHYKKKKDWLVHYDQLFVSVWILLPLCVFPSPCLYAHFEVKHWGKRWWKCQNEYPPKII